MGDFALHVSPLSLNITSDHLTEIFGKFGKVTDADVAKNQFNQSLGWGYVRYEEEENAKIAIKKMNNGQIDGLTLIVRPATPEDSIPERKVGTD